MKNYLFAPFKDDDDKIREFNAMFKALMHLVDAEHELHVIRVFVCRLESYHDSIIQDMHNNKAEIVDGLLEESNLLKAELQAVNDKDGLYDEVKELQAVNDTYQGEIFKLEAEIKKLQVENIKLNSECWCGCNDDLRAEHMEIIAENKALEYQKKRLNDSYIELRKEYNDNYQDLRKKNKELQAENDRLISQVSSNRGNSSSTHTHTLGSVRCSIAREIAEYMENNDTCKDARLFLLPIEEFSDGVHNRDIDWDDGME